MTEAVLADAQFGTATIVKPFPNFEQVYAGLPTTTPIAFPGTLDPDAGKDGFDPDLLRGIPVPMGSKVLLWIPTIFNENPDTGAIEVVKYRYRIYWRLRNLRDFRESRQAYHFPRQSLGEDSQFVIPASQNGIVFEGAKKDMASGTQDPVYGVTSDADFSLESVSFTPLLNSPAKTPAGNDASYQQGLGMTVGNKRVSFNPLWVDCGGDEMIIEAFRDLPAVPGPGLGIWTFGTPGPTNPAIDRGFSDLYGNGSEDGPFPDLGIYVFTGSNP